MQTASPVFATMEDVKAAVRDVLLELFPEGVAAPQKRSWLRPSEVAERYNTTQSALSILRFKGKGPRFTKSGGRIRYDIEDLEFYFRSGKQKTIDQD